MKTLMGFGTALFAAAIVGWASPSAAGCGINLSGRYDTAVQSGGETLRLYVYLNGVAHEGKKSQVRKKLGTWARIKDCDWSTRSYDVGGSFTVACKLDFGCSAKRRYRVIVAAKNSSGVTQNSAYKYYPSSTGWTEAINVDLGDLGKLF